MLARLEAVLGHRPRTRARRALALGNWPRRSDRVELVHVVENRGLRGSCGAEIVVTRDGVEQLGPNVRGQPGASLLDHAQAEMHVAEQRPFLRGLEERPPVELLHASDVVQQRCCQKQVGTQSRVHERGLPRQGRDGHGVLEKSAGIAVMAARRGRELAQARPNAAFREAPLDDGVQVGMMDLRCEKVEEAVELVQVAPCFGDERGRIDLSALERANLELQAVAKSLDSPEHADGIALLEPPVEQLDVVPDTRVDAPARVDQLEGKIGSPGPGPKPLLACHGEDPFDEPILLELGNWHYRSHGSSLWRAVDARLAEMASTGPEAPLAKPFRALRFDPSVAGSIDDLVAPPWDVISDDRIRELVARNLYNVIRLIRPLEPEVAASRIAEWTKEGVLVREAVPAVWVSEEEFTGPDGVSRARHGVVARVRLADYSEGIVLPHERIFPASAETRLRILRATRIKLSPVLMLHDGPALPVPERGPDLVAQLDQTTTRLWRVDDRAGIEAVLASVVGPLVIADGHHRYDSALRFHREQPGEETAYVLAVLVSHEDPGLTIFPTHRLVSGPVPELNGALRLSQLGDAPPEAFARLERLPRDHSAFVAVRANATVLAEAPPSDDALERLDVSALERLGLEGVSFTPSLVEVEDALRSGRADAAFLVRAPTVDEVQDIARGGRTMPEKSTYFYPKLTSGLLFSPFDE